MSQTSRSEKKLHVEVFVLSDTVLADLQFKLFVQLLWLMSLIGPVVVAADQQSYPLPSPEHSQAGLRSQQYLWRPLKVEEEAKIRLNQPPSLPGRGYKFRPLSRVEQKRISDRKNVNPGLNQPFRFRPYESTKERAIGFSKQELIRFRPHERSPRYLLEPQFSRSYPAR